MGNALYSVLPEWMVDSSWSPSCHMSCPRTSQLEILIYMLNSAIYLPIPKAHIWLLPETGKLKKVPRTSSSYIPSIIRIFFCLFKTSSITTRAADSRFSFKSMFCLVTLILCDGAHKPKLVSRKLKSSDDGTLRILIFCIKCVHTRQFLSVSAHSVYSKVPTEAVAGVTTLLVTQNARRSNRHSAQCLW